MKNMTKKSSFFNTFSAGLILSCLGTTVFKCEASLQEEAGDESSRPAAASSSANSAGQNAQAMPRRELIEPEFEAELKAFWLSLNETYRTLMLAAYNYQEKEAFAQEVADNSKKAFPEMTSALADVKKAHRFLLLNKKEIGQMISKLRVDHDMQKAKIAELEEQLNLAKASPVVVIPHNPEQDIRFAELEKKVREQAERIIQLETSQEKRSEASEDTIVLIPDTKEKDQQISKLQAEKDELVARITALEKQTLSAATGEIKLRRAYWLNPFSWLYYLFPVLDQAVKSKV